MLSQNEKKLTAKIFGLIVRAISDYINQQSRGVQQYSLAQQLSKYSLAHQESKYSWAYQESKYSVSSIKQAKLHQGSHIVFGTVLYCKAA